MRATDLAPPAITPHPLPPGAPLARWPGHLVIGLERLPQAAYVWDDDDDAVVWDDGVNVPGVIPSWTNLPAGFAGPYGSRLWAADVNHTYRWDAPGTWNDVGVGYLSQVESRYVYDAPFVGSGFTDAVCDFQALTIESGEPDELGLYPPGQLTLSLANPTGEYTQRTVDGRLVYYAPGRRVAVGWVDQASVWWWLFGGRVTDWIENADGTVAVEAFTGFAELAGEPGAPWTPGTAGQLPGIRMEAILAAFGYVDARRLDLGDVALLAPVTTRAPLEELQTVALSDGGVVFCDADGTVVYRNRGWRSGRSDQTTVPALSDNVCTADAVVWDLELANADDGLATDVVLTNAATPTPVTVRSSVSQSDASAWWYQGPRYRLTHPDPDLWSTTGDGQALADFLLSVRSSPNVAIGAFSLYVNDPKQNLWALATNRRIGDRLRFVRDQVEPGGDVATLDVQLVLASIRHEITPDGWLATFTTSRSVAYLEPELWDITAFVYDQTDERNTWRY